MEVAESRASKLLVQEKEDTIANLQNEFTQARFALTPHLLGMGFIEKLGIT